MQTVPHACFNSSIIARLVFCWLLPPYYFKKYKQAAILEINKIYPKKMIISCSLFHITYSCLDIFYVEK